MLKSKRPFCRTLFFTILTLTAGSTEIEFSGLPFYLKRIRAFHILIPPRLGRRWRVETYVFRRVRLRREILPLFGLNPYFFIFFLLSSTLKHSAVNTGQLFWWFLFISSFWFNHKILRDSAFRFHSHFNEHTPFRVKFIWVNS